MTRKEFFESVIWARVLMILTMIVVFCLGWYGPELNQYLPESFKTPWRW